MKLVETWGDQRLWRMIKRSDGERIGKMIRMIMKRYEIYHPNEEMLFAVIPRNDWEERKRILDTMCSILINQKMDSLR